VLTAYSANLSIRAGFWVTLPTCLCSGRFSDRRRFNGIETRYYFFGCGACSGGASLLGGTMFFSRMYVTRLP
jgi:hypothetical protein